MKFNIFHFKAKDCFLIVPPCKLIGNWIVFENKPHKSCLKKKVNCHRIRKPLRYEAMKSCY